MTFGAADEKKELPGANHCLDDESKHFEDGVVRMAQGDDNLRINASDANVKDESEQVSQAQVVMQVQEGQARGSGVCWKQFLHLRSIRVLLVENDDSTRHIVNALLLNCNYEVIEAANGSQAWRILEDLTIHIDLILTEVVMPSLSGIGLLCKIMSHKTRKNVPVIMMSSHDSMGLVIKCLSKGAVDFLGKPIRKNELKNLWQHVWRRCQSSSGSGSESESGTQTQKSVKLSESNGKSDNDSESNAGENNRSTGLNVRDGSDGGSGTQSSWTKQAVEVDSSQAATPRVQVAECPDSTCAQVVHSNYEASYNKGLPLAATKECQKDEQLNDVAKTKDLMMAEPINIELQPENADEVPFKLGKKEGNLPENDSNASSKQIENVQANPIIECIPNKHKSVVTSISGPQLHSQQSEVPREHASEVKKVNVLSNEQVMELSLKRLRRVNDAEEKYQDDRNILRRSELSAFSRYNTSSIAFRAPNGVLGSCSSLTNSPGVVRKESMSDILSHSNGPSSNDDIDKGSYTNKFSQNLVLTKDKLEATLMINGLHSSSAFIPVKNKVRRASHQVLGIKDDDVATSALLVSAGGLQQKFSVQQSHQHHHNFHYMEQPPSSNCNYSSLNKLAADTRQCGSSNMLDRPADGNPVNCTLNRSASGSNHGSNGKNGSSTPVNAVGETIQSEVGLTGSGDASSIGHGNRTDQNKHARRAAALTKFRQKRTELCFQKKIRYQNRKRVAEQRPRVRGQFVRKTGNENSTDAVDD